MRQVCGSEGNHMDEKLMLMGWGKTDRTENRKNGTYIRGVRGREYFHEGGGSYMLSMDPTCVKRRE